MAALQPSYQPGRYSPMATEPSTPPKRRRRLWIPILGTLVAAVVLAVILFQWDWLLPVVDAQASKALGRKVTAQHLHVALGRTTTVVLDGVQVANPDGFADTTPFAQADKLTVLVDIMAYLHGRKIVIPQIVLDNPQVEAVQQADGKATWDLPALQSKPDAPPSDPADGPQLGQLVINNGHAHVVIAKLKADFKLDVATRAPDAVKEGAERDKATANAGQIVVDAKGTYAAQPITGQFIGGALLSLRDASNPYPVDLHLANGPTKVALVGTIQNPLKFAGAELKLQLSGPDMAKLEPLTGVPIPETPAYDIAGKLDYADRKVKFTGFTGKLGNSDLNGDISIDPTGAKPLIDANLFSHKVELADLGGFIGETPGRKGEANQSAQQKTELARKETSSHLLPDTPVNLPKVNAANIRLHYKGEHIEGRSVPLDDIVANLAITDGRIQLEPLTFAVGTGQIALTADLVPVGKNVKANVKVDFKRVSLGRLLEATHLVNGGGTLSGSAALESTGDSLAQLLGRGNGGLKLGLQGGNLSALLADLAGLEFGNALLSALGIPNRAELRCFVADFSLLHGILSTKTLLVDTSESQIHGTGDVNLSNETIDYKIKADSVHFSIGTLPTPIDVTGPLKSPSIKPEIGPLAARAGAAVGLGVLFPPAALIPLIQLGVGEDNTCAAQAGPISAGRAVATATVPTRRGTHVRRTVPVRRRR